MFCECHGGERCCTLLSRPMVCGAEGPCSMFITVHAGMRAMGACGSQRTTLWSRTFPSILKEIDPSYWTQVSGCQTASPAACLHLLVWGPCELHFYLHLPRCCSQSLRANLVPVLTLSLSSSAVAGVTRMSVDMGRTRGWVPPSSFSSVALDYDNVCLGCAL